MRVVAAMMQKDEVALLPAWLAYHTRLFEAENLLVIDNGSQLPAIRAQLDSAKRRGVTVIIRPERKHFENKGRVIQEAVSSLGYAPDAVFPIDCDEFLGVSRDGSFTSSRFALFSEIERFLDSGRAVGRIASAYWNIPGSTGTYRHTHRKVFFRGDADVVLDRGFHLFDSRTGRPTHSHLEQSSAVSMLHFHNRPFPEMIESAKIKLGQKVVQMPMERKKAYQGAGKHMLRFLFISEQEYKESLGKPQFDCEHIFSEISMTVPFSVSAKGDAF